MSQVTIHRCPVCPSIKSHTDQVVRQLNNDGIIPAVRDGKKGEFRIDVNNKRLIEKSDESLPSVETCVKAVEQQTDSGLLVS